MTALSYISGNLPSISGSAFLGGASDHKVPGFQGDKVNHNPLVISGTIKVKGDVMKERIAKLEVHVDHMQQDIGDIKTRVQRIETKILIGTGIASASVAILGWLGYIINNYLPQILHAIQLLETSGR